MDFRLDFQTSCITAIEPENYLPLISGQVVSVGGGDEEDDDQEEQAGTVELYLANIEGADAAGFDPEYLLDLYASTQPFFDACFDPGTCELKPQLDDDTCNRNLLILNKLELFPAFRGEGHGLRILYHCIEQFAHGCAIAVLLCLPLQFGGLGTDAERALWLSRMDMGSYGTDQRQCTLRLKQHYRKLGFKSIGRTDYMFLKPSRLRSQRRIFGSG
jgi:hypothetical protein